MFLFVITNLLRFIIDMVIISGSRRVQHDSKRLRWDKDSGLMKIDGLEYIVPSLSYFCCYIFVFAFCEGFE